MELKRNLKSEAIAWIATILMLLSGVIYSWLVKGVFESTLSIILFASLLIQGIFYIYYRKKE